MCHYILRPVWGWAIFFLPFARHSANANLYSLIHSTGQLASGSCDGQLFIYNPTNAQMTDMAKDDAPYTHHKQSVEDIAWSPENEHQLASCNYSSNSEV